MKNTKMNKMTRIFPSVLLACMLLLLPQWAKGQVQLILDSAEAESLTQLMAGKTQDLLVAMDAYSHTGSAEFSDEPGIDDAREILQNRPLRISRDTLYSQVIRVGTGGYELRQLFMQFGQTSHEFVELVVRFDSEGQLMAVREANELHNFDRVLSRATLAESSDAQKVEQVLEEFSAAFNNKDSQRLAEFLPEDALVISGSVTNGQVVYARTEATTYLQRLESGVFPNNEEIDVRFDQVQVFINPGYRNVFGVSVYQYWNTTNYSDKGYVAFMVDLRDSENPLIHTRFWQPAPFEVGRYAELEPDPLELAMIQRNIETSQFGYIDIAVHSQDSTLLNTDLLKEWVRQEIVDIPAAALNASQMEKMDETTLRVSFDMEPGFLDTELLIYDTALLSSLRAPLRLVSGYAHQIELYVLQEDESAPESDPFADVFIETNPRDTQLSMKRIADSTIAFEKPMEHTFLFYRTQPGEYLLVVEKEGYESYESELVLRSGRVTQEQVRLQRISPPPVVEVEEPIEEERPGFYARNRMLVWAAVAVTTASAAIMVIDGSDLGSDVQVLPPPPGRP